MVNEAKPRVKEITIGQARDRLKTNPKAILMDVREDSEWQNGHARGAHLGLAFYRPDYGLDLGPDGEPTGTRSDFVRGSDGNIAWFRNHGRLYQKQ